MRRIRDQIDLGCAQADAQQIFQEANVSIHTHKPTQNALHEESELTCDWNSYALACGADTDIGSWPSSSPCARNALITFFACSGTSFSEFTSAEFR